MCSPNIIFRIAGVFIMASVALGVWVHPAWLAFTAFVGFNLFQFSFSGFCPLERLLGAAGWLGCQRRLAR
jgi:hypothetical protein